MYLHPINPFDGIIFDCDGTLSCVEGIKQLAKMNGNSQYVKKLIEEAIGEGLLNHQVYKECLGLLKPTQAQVEKLGKLYAKNPVEDVEAVIKLFQQLNKKIYIVTSSLKPAVLPLAKRFNIPKSHVFAVDIQFDNQGNYADFDHQSPLVELWGKRHIVEKLQKKHSSLLHIGYGLNNYADFNLVDRFVGYGGVCFRQKMAELCDFYITSSSISPLVPLALTQEEINHLSLEVEPLYQKGLTCLNYKSKAKS